MINSFNWAVIVSDRKLYVNFVKEENGNFLYLKVTKFCIFWMQNRQSLGSIPKPVEIVAFPLTQKTWNGRREEQAEL